jgi:hypothetical protein
MTFDFENNSSHVKDFWSQDLCVDKVLAGYWRYHGGFPEDLSVWLIGRMADWESLSKDSPQVTSASRKHVALKSVRHSCQILTKTGMCRQILVKILICEFNKIRTWSWVVTCGQTCKDLKLSFETVTYLVVMSDVHSSRRWCIIQPKYKFQK